MENGGGRGKRGGGGGRGRGRGGGDGAGRARGRTDRGGRGSSRGSGRGRGRGGGGGGGSDAAAALLANHAEKQQQEHAAATYAPVGGRWWEQLKEDDPISLEPLAELNYPPFPLMNEDGESSKVATQFDGRVLAQYLVSTGTFEHPITRRELTHSECASLDVYLTQHKLGQGKVAEAQSRKDEYKPDAEGNRGALGLQVEASTLLAALFENSNRHGLQQSMRRSREEAEGGGGRGRGGGGRGRGGGGQGCARASDLELQVAIRESLDLARRERETRAQRQKGGGGRGNQPSDFAVNVRQKGGRGKQPAKAPKPEQEVVEEEADFWADDGEDEPAVEDDDDDDDEDDPSSLTPEEVRSRNARMVAAMSDSVQGDQGKLSAIKKLSQRLRKRQVGVEAFTEELSALAGVGVESFFGDLVLLMRVGDTTGDMAVVSRELKSCRRDQLARESAARSEVLYMQRFQ